MIWNKTTRPIWGRGAGLLALFLFGVSNVAWAENTTCVVCKDPDLTYRCSVIRSDGTRVSGFSFYCIKEIAREGHRSCSVKLTESGVCEGVEKTLVYDGRAPRGTRQQETAAPVHGPVEPGVQKKEEPKTLIELTDQTVESSKKGLKNTGAAIGGAAKKTGDTVVGAAKKTGDTVVGAVKKTGQAVGGAAKKTGQAVGGAAKKTGETVGGAVKKTGQAIGSAAKTTYNCVTSLFTKCF